MTARSLFAAMAALLLPALAWAAPVTVESNAISVKLRLQEIAFIDLPDSSRTVTLEVTGDCPEGQTVCVANTTPIEFVLRGNTSVDLTLIPGVQAELEGRRLGQFAAVSPEESADAQAPIYFDLLIELDDAGAPIDLDTLAPLSLQDLQHNPEAWSQHVDLSTGPKRGRVIVRPVLDLSFSDIFVSPGTYIASVDLSIATR